MAALYQRLSTTISEMDTTSIEYHIASIMIANLTQIYNIPIGRMAKLCSVSKSSVSKFVRTLGFEDYQEFKAEALFCSKKEIYMKGAAPSILRILSWRMGRSIIWTFCFMISAR